MAAGERAPASRLIPIEEDDSVKVSLCSEGQELPTVLEPLRPSVDLGWIATHTDEILARLRRSGALLFRGWPVRTSDDFQRCANLVSGPLMEHRERSPWREAAGDRLYTSTNYPAHEEIFPHNEYSYSVTIPTHIVFWCERPAIAGGETPLVDSRRVYSRIDPAVRLEFEQRRWMYVRNIPVRPGVWPATMASDDEFEQYCEDESVRYEWKSPTRLRTWRVRPATLRHPSTGEMSWFNHLTFAHVTTLSAALLAKMRATYQEDELPTNTYYGDGTPIDEHLVARLRDIYRAETKTFQWQQHDVLLVDNISAAHGRRSFSGERRILVALGSEFKRVDV